MLNKKRAFWYGALGTLVVVLGGTCSHPTEPTLLVTLDRLTTDAEIRLFDGATPPGKVSELVDSLVALLPVEEGDVTVAQITSLIYDTLGIVPVVDHAPPETFLLTRMVAEKRGSCVGLVGLYVLIAERVHLSLHARLLPGHLTVCAPEADTLVNYETLRKGRIRSDAFYRSYYQPRHEWDTLYRLSAEQFTGVYAYNIGNAYRDKGLLHDAARMYRTAIQQFPGYPPVQDNLKQILTILGE